MYRVGNAQKLEAVRGRIRVASGFAGTKLSRAPLEYLSNPGCDWIAL
jgi:hypothetical protein